MFEKNILDIIKTQESKEVAGTFKKQRDISSGYYFIAVRIAESGELESLLNDFCIENNGNYLCEETGKYDASRIRTTKYHQRTDRNLEYIKYAKDTKEFVLFSLIKFRTYIGLSQLVLKRGFYALKNTKVQRYKPLERDADDYLTGTITKFNPMDLESYFKSKQKYDEYTVYRKWTFYYWLPIWWKLLFPTALILLIYLIRASRAQIPLVFENLIAIFYLMLGHIINTIICGTFSNFENIRYSSRTLWLINFAIILIFMNGFYYYQNRPKRKILKAKK